MSELKLESVTEGLLFPEGPVAMADGSVIVVEIKGGRLTRVRPNGRHETIAELGQGPNGAAIGPDGALYVCNNGDAWSWMAGEGHFPAGPPAHPYTGGSIQRVDLRTGKFATLYDSCDGRPLNSPNDIVFDETGGFWFTCLGYHEGEARRYGGVYYARPDGSKIIRARGEMLSPNGVGLSPDGRIVYAADCMVGRLYAFDLIGPGAMVPLENPLMPGRVVCTLPGFQWLDSMAIEASGRICVATLWNGGISVFQPTGEYEHFPTPDVVTTNLCFGGADMRDAWITCSSTGKLYRCRWPRPGLRLPFNG
jgi:gluconolactonase